MILNWIYLNGYLAASKPLEPHLEIGTFYIWECSVYKVYSHFYINSCLQDCVCEKPFLRGFNGREAQALKVFGQAYSNAMLKLKTHGEEKADLSEYNGCE